ncbi:MAG TPA: single-stranded-DNA-specific exonuclease RecJ, partial [Thermopetrobacter sp.]|nr:single-stranded-DNA-specific exonuclease RecJ [Thermopetrobacter sp.]
AAMLAQFLGHCGITCHVHIPHRIDEGYGPSVAAVDDLKGRGAQVLVTLDCGAMAHDVLAHATASGLDVLVIDHHQMGETLPDALAVVNPNRLDDTSGLGHLCAGGLTFMLIAATARALEEAGFWAETGRERPDVRRWLDLVALATVCDVVPLKGLNRAYVNGGLKVLAARARPGLAALADAARLNGRADTHALGFVLGPRLNAAGRIHHAREAFALLTAQDTATAQALAAKLDRLNRERQEIEARQVEEAMAMAERQREAAAMRAPLVVAAEDWHPGVVGLIAARLKERFHLPAVALAIDERTGEAVGSARSITGVDIGRAVARAVAAGVLARGGGHAMAAGMALPVARIDDFRAFLAAATAAELSVLPEAPEMPIDGALLASGATRELVELLERAGPFGAGNPQPVFAFPAHRVQWARVVGEHHVSCTLIGSDGGRLKAIAFRALDTDLGETLLAERDAALHVAGTLMRDDYNGRNGAQLRIIDAAVARR